MAHVFGYSLWYAYFDGDCLAGNTCHTNSQAGTCQMYHYACGMMSADFQNTIADALASSDPDVVRKLASAFPARVRVSETGQALMLFDCDGTAAGEVPLNAV